MQSATEISNLSGEQRELVERFEAAFNSIDRFLRIRLGREQPAFFSSLVADYERMHKRGADCDFLRVAGELRNLLVHHQKTKPYQPVAVPTVRVVDRLTAHDYLPRNDYTTYPGTELKRQNP